MLTITDQEWIKSRMFQICAVEKDLEDFVKDEGKMLLVIALRRESDREYKIDAMKPKPSIKSSMLKLFSILTIWNLRASYCDLKVMIREVSDAKFEGNEKEVNFRHFQAKEMATKTLSSWLSPQILLEKLEEVVAISFSPKMLSESAELRLPR